MIEGQAYAENLVDLLPISENNVTDTLFPKLKLKNIKNIFFSKARNFSKKRLESYVFRSPRFQLHK